MMERLEKAASSADDNTSASTAATNTSTTSRYSGSGASVGSGSTTSSTGSRNTKSHTKSPDDNKIKSYLSKAREQREKEKQQHQEQQSLAKGGAEALLLQEEDALSPPSSSPVDELVEITPTGRKVVKKAIQRDPHLEPLASSKTTTSSSSSSAGTPLFGGTTAASAKLSSSFWKEHHGDRLADPTEDTPTRQARKKAIVVRLDEYELAGTMTDLESMGGSSSPTSASTSTYSSLRGGGGGGSGSGRGGKGRRAPARSTSTTWRNKPGILKQDEKTGLFGSLRNNVWCCRFLGLLLAAGLITLVVLLSVSLARRNSSESGFTTGNDKEQSTFLEVGEGATVESDGSLGGANIGFVIVVVVMFVVTLSIFGLQWMVKRQKQKRAEAQKSAIFAYLQNFDVEDVDLRKSPPGGWHGTYLNKLSYGINKAEWGNLQQGDNTLAEKVETAPLTHSSSHSSIVKDSLFLV